MLLAIDCGNTNTVFSVWDGAKFRVTWRISTDHKRTADEYFVWLSSLIALMKSHGEDIPAESLRAVGLSARTC